MTALDRRALATLVGLDDVSRVVWVAGSQRRTAGAVMSYAQECASLIASWQGGRVIVPTSNPFEAIVGILAAKLAGATAVMWRSDAMDLETLIALTGARGRFDFDGVTGRVGMVDVSDVRSTDHAPGDVIMPTSGSTGAPKGVAFNLEQAAANAALAGVGLGIEDLQFWAIDGDLSTISALSHVLMAWRFDKPLYHFKGVEWAERGAAFRGAKGGYGGAPLQLREMSQRLKVAAPAAMVSSGDFLMPALADAIVARFPETKLHKMYGLTECAGRFCVLPHDERRRQPEAAGRPMSGFAVTIEPDGDDPAVGEILIETPFLFHGYWRLGEGFVARSGGPFRTGDRGTIDVQGLVTVLGRINDVFKVGGEKVDRHSVEAVLQPLFAQTEYCVLPVPHAVFGLTPALFVAASTVDPRPSRAAIVSAIRAALPARFVPTLMLECDGQLPRLASGKIDRQSMVRHHLSLRDYNLVDNAGS